MHSRLVGVAGDVFPEGRRPEVLHLRSSDESKIPLSFSDHQVLPLSPSDQLEILLSYSDQTEMPLSFSDRRYYV